MALRDRLHRELGVQPEPETTRLCEAIRQGREPGMPASPRAPACPTRLRPCPTGPSIAVLPFQNMSGDPEQEYFADGIVEEIITALSRMRWLFVIARNSSFTYKGRTVDVKQVGRELGVRYVLEGSVRKAGDRVRITGQLMDASTGAHLWADRSTAARGRLRAAGPVTASVVGAIAPKLEQAEIERANASRPPASTPTTIFCAAWPAVHGWTREANARRSVLFNHAIELDPDFAAAYGMAARCFSQRKSSGWVEDRTGSPRPTVARRAAELGPRRCGGAGGAAMSCPTVGDLDDGAR